MFFGLSGLSELLSHSTDPVVRVETAPDKSVEVIFEDFEGFDLAHVHVDPHSELLSVVAENLEGTLSTNRSVKLPCTVEYPHKITAQMHAGRVKVIIPRDALAEAAPATQAASEGLPGMKELAVHVYPPRAGKMEVEHQGAILTITVHGMRSDDSSVDIEGRELSITGKSADGSADINRHFKLHKRLVKPDAVKAAFDEAQSAIVVTIPDDALEARPKAKRTKIPIGG